MLEKPVKENTAIRYDNSPLTTGVNSTLDLEGRRQLTPPLQDPDDLTATPYDEYTLWILTAAQKKLQRETKLGWQQKLSRHSSFGVSVTDPTIDTQTSQDQGDHDRQLIKNNELDQTKDNGQSDGDKLTQQGVLEETGENYQRQRRRQRRHTILGPSSLLGLGDSGICRKSTTTPTRLPTPKSSYTHLSTHVPRPGSNIASSLPASTHIPKRTRHLSVMDGAILKLQDLTHWRNQVSLEYAITSRPQDNRKPASMNSPLRTRDSDRHKAKPSIQSAYFDPYSSNDSSNRKYTFKYSGKYEEGMICHAPANEPKISQRYNTVATSNTRIPLPITKKTEPNDSATATTSEQYNQKLGPSLRIRRRPGNGIIRRPSLLSNDLLQEQRDKERKQSQCLDVNLISVQGELCVPDCISQQDTNNDHSPSSSSILSANRPLQRRISSLHDWLQELAYDESAWNEITKLTTQDSVKSTYDDDWPGNNISAQQFQHLTGTTTTTNSSSSKCPSQHSPISSNSTPPLHSIRPGMSPLTAFKLYQQYLSPFERQEIMTYSQIFFVGRHVKNKHKATLDKPDNNYGYDDERGDYLFVLNDHLAYRYEVLETMGKGSFGQVVKAFDYQSGCIVAVKLIRNKKRFHAQALVEIKTLEDLIKWDPDDKHNNVRMTDHFYFRNHLCIAFECLSINLYDFIKSSNFQGFSMGLIRRFTIQLLNSLMILHQHQLIHCDLKPENILLKHPTKSTIKVIDFGSSCLENEKVYTYIQSRFYRAPEVILGLDYGTAIDMWSVGCILAELYTGYPLFPGENEHDQLACIMEVQGVPGRTLVEKSARRMAFFDFYGNPKIVPNSKGKKRKPGTRSLAQTLKCSDEKFVDFIDRCLQWNPQHRVKPEEAFKHGWIARQTQ